MTLFRRLVAIAFALTALVVVFGAYVRLSDAGLGCPDWPGCYGQPSPHHAAEDIARTHAAHPQGPVSLPKAWKEMIHRYLAATLGLLIIGLAVLAWRSPDVPRGVRGPAAALVAVVIFQGLLGKWTVTLLLKPAIVTAHLVGGLTTLGLLAWLLLRTRSEGAIPAPRGMILTARTAFVLLAAQILLGGWTSTNYAALACPDFPTCQGSFNPPAEFRDAFHVLRELGMTADGEALPLAALTAIHWAHRIGALVAGVALVVLGGMLLRRQATRLAGFALLAALAAQILVGVANVVLSLPLPLAVAHNAGAALLLVLMIWINCSLRWAALPARLPNGRTSDAGRENSYA